MGWDLQESEDPESMKVFEKAPGPSRAAVAHRYIIHTMVYMYGIRDLCSAQPTQLYEVTLVIRLGRVLSSSVQRGRGKWVGQFPGRTVVSRKQCGDEARKPELKILGKLELRLGSLFAHSPAGRQPCTQATGVRGWHYHKGYSSGQRASDAGTWGEAEERNPK